MEDERLSLITEQIVRLASADFSTPGEPSEKGDDLDAIVVGLNLLGEELSAYTAELKAKEERISQMLLQLEEAQQLSHIGSWEWITGETHVNWSAELYRIYGRSPDTFDSTFEHFIESIHPEDREQVGQIIAIALEQKEDFEFEHRIIRPDGTERYLDCKGSVFLNEEGEVGRMTGTAQDITELHKAREHIQNLAAIVESSNDAIIAETREGEITSWNKQAEKLFGYSEEEVVGKHISILYTEDQKNGAHDLPAGEDESATVEAERVTKDGRTIVVSSTISPIRNMYGKVIGYSNISRDITEKKLAEQRLLHYTTVLEQKTRESEQFAYVTSHDLQEPLRTITNYIGLFRDDFHGKVDERADRYIDLIGRAASRMQILIRDLLDYTRLGSEQETETIDTNQLIEEIKADLNQIITENVVVIKTKNLPVISAQFSQTKSLFQNLISNGIKFRSPERNPVLTIIGKETSKDWIFEVKDNGIGIEPEYFEKIFLLFQRLHARSEYPGSGIGLAHCKKIVELCGGKISVTSVPGQGSSFHFNIPKNTVK